MLQSLRSHWPEYLMEAAELAIFMISAAGFTILIFHPISPIPEALPNEVARRLLMGGAMGSTLVALIYSPWGKRSGAHMNPAFTLTFFRLGKVAGWDAAFYMIAQFIGGVFGVLLVFMLAPKSLAHPSVNFVATIPGSGGSGLAFLAEVCISFILLLVVLFCTNHQRLAPYTGLFAATCVTLFITFESPLSGMSMNPARTFGSALLPRLWETLWIYFTAPVIGMLAAVELFKRFRSPSACPKYHHQNRSRCIFCEHLRSTKSVTVPSGGFPKPLHSSANAGRPRWISETDRLAS